MRPWEARSSAWRPHSSTCTLHPKPRTFTLTPQTPSPSAPASPPRAQEELVYATLESQLQRVAPIQQHRAALIARANECRDEPEVLEELLAQINACLRTYQIIAFVHGMSVYGSILRADQMAVYLLSAWPYMPSLSGLFKALQVIRERRAAGEAQTQAQG